MKSTPDHLKTRNKKQPTFWKIVRIVAASPIAWIGLFFTIIGDGLFRFADLIGGEAYETFGEEPFTNKTPRP